MQAVSQSYSSQIYSQIQNTPGSTGSRGEGAKKQSSPNDPTEISSQGRELSKEASKSPQAASETKSNQEAPSASKKPNQQNLSAEDLKFITDLQRRDTEVRAHEQAHLSAAGQYAAGGASFSYTTGPNGKRYANGGEVPIDVGREKTPEATIQKMRTVRRAALAPAQPSGADRSIAAQASATEAQAMKEVQEQVESPVAKTASTSPATEQSPETESPREKNSKEASNTPQVSGSSRRSMTSAYQAIAALAP